MWTKIARRDCMEKNPIIDLSKLPPFDREADEVLRARISEAHASVHDAMAHRRSAEWWRRYAAYLSSKEWHKMREAVLANAACVKDAGNLRNTFTIQ